MLAVICTFACNGHLFQNVILFLSTLLFIYCFHSGLASVSLSEPLFFFPFAIKQNTKSSIILQNLFHFSSTFLSWCHPRSVRQPVPMTEGFGHGVVQDGWLAPSIALDHSGALWQSWNDFQVGNFSQSLSIKPPASGSGTFVMTDEYFFDLTWLDEQNCLSFTAALAVMRLPAPGHNDCC